MGKRLDQMEEALWIAIRHLRDHKDPLDELILAALFHTPVGEFRESVRREEAKWGLFDPLPDPLGPELQVRETRMKSLLEGNRYLGHAFLERRVPVADVLLAERALGEIARTTPFYRPIAENNLDRLFKLSKGQYKGFLLSLKIKGLIPPGGWLEEFAKLRENRYMDILNDLSLPEFIQCPTRKELTITEKDALFLWEVGSNPTMNERYMTALWGRLGIRGDREYISLQEEASVRPTMRFLTFGERHLLTLARFGEFDEWIRPVMERVDRAEGLRPIRNLADFMGQHLAARSIVGHETECLPILGEDPLLVPSLPSDVKEAIRQMESCFGKPWDRSVSLEGLTPREAQLSYVSRLSSKWDLLSQMDLAVRRSFLRKMYYGVSREAREEIDYRMRERSVKQREEVTEAFLGEVARLPEGDPCKRRVLYLYQRFLRERGVGCLLEKEELSRQLFQQVIAKKRIRI